MINLYKCRIKDIFSLNPKQFYSPQFTNAGRKDSHPKEKEKKSSLESEEILDCFKIFF